MSRVKIKALSVQEINTRLAYLESLILAQGPTTDASLLTSGTLDDARLSANIGKLASNNTWTGSNTFEPTGTGEQIVIREMSGSTNSPIRITYTGYGGTGLAFNWRTIAFPTDGNSAIAFSNQGGLITTTTNPILFQKNSNDAGVAFRFNQQQGTGDIAQFEFGGADKATIDKDGVVSSSKFKLTALNTAPSSAPDTGTTGEIRIDANHIYVCVATNTWKRVAIATW